MTTATRDRLVELFADVTAACDREGVLAEAVAELESRPGLVARLVAVYSSECRTPPNEEGWCMRCGHRLADPIKADKAGCSPVGILADTAAGRRVRRVVFRTQRLIELYRAAL